VEEIQRKKFVYADAVTWPAIYDSRRTG